MFSDYIFDALCILEENLDLAYPNIYDQEAVINMLVAMTYVQKLGDARLPDGTLIHTKEELMEEAKKYVKQLYECK